MLSLLEFSVLTHLVVVALLLLLLSQVLAAEQINMILTAVVAGMRPDEPNDDARLAATTALQNAIEFAEHNFENESERNYIMQVRARQQSA
jgi:hypothetical protein